VTNERDRYMARCRMRHWPSWKTPRSEKKAAQRQAKQLERQDTEEAAFPGPALPATVLVIELLRTLDDLDEAAVTLGHAGLE
jgi:hypothetical protein